MNTLRRNPVRRSNLIVPVSNERFVQKAHLRGADSITLDLEDGVAPSMKAHARERLADAVEQAGQGGAFVGVRINRPLDLAVRDIEAAVIPGVAFLAVAKAQSASHIRLLSELVGKLEEERGIPHGSIRFSASIESPSALENVHSIAGADSRLWSIGLGSEDFASACGMEPTPESLFFPKQMIIFAARSAGIQPFGYIASVADYTNLDELRTVIRRSKKLGFRGGGAIHPAQIPVLNEEFGPSREEIESARALVEEARTAEQEGRGAFSWRGKMIDRPIVDRALELLQLAEDIEARTGASHRT